MVRQHSATRAPGAPIRRRSAPSCASPASPGRRSSAPSPRAHVIAWRDELAGRSLGGSTVRHRLASLSSLFEHLCERNAVTHNPVKGVKRPRAEGGEGKTPALGDHQARQLLAAPADDSLRGKRDRALLSTLLFHALRRDELCKLRVKDAQHARRGVPHLRVQGKGEKIRYVPLHPGTAALIHDYLEAAGHGVDDAGALFRPLRNNRTDRLEGAITPDGIYKLVRTYSGCPRVRDWSARAARYGGDQRPRPRGRHRQGAGMAGARQHRHHPHLRPPPHSAGGQSDLQGYVLSLDVIEHPAADHRGKSK